MESFPDLGVDCEERGGDVGLLRGLCRCVMWVIGDELFNHCSFFVRVLLCSGLDGGLMI